MSLAVLELLASWFKACFIVVIIFAAGIHALFAMFQFSGLLASIISAEQLMIFIIQFLFAICLTLPFLSVGGAYLQNLTLLPFDMGHCVDLYRNLG